jgi:hypothetical protein
MFTRCFHLQGCSPAATLLGARLTLIRIHCKPNEQTADDTLCRTRFRTGCAPVAAMNENTRTVRDDVTCDVEEDRESFEKCDFQVPTSRVHNDSTFLFRMFCRVEW